MKSIQERFFEKVEMIPFHSCWEWSGNKRPDNYGRMDFKKKSYRAHRLSWEIHRGPILDGLFVCHKCDNPSCVNPNHLFLGTNKDNILDRNKKNRANMPHGEAHHKRKLSIKDVKDIRLSVLSSRKLGKIYGVSHRTILYAKKAGWKSV